MPMHAHQKNNHANFDNCDFLINFAANGGRGAAIQCGVNGGRCAPAARKETRRNRFRLQKSSGSLYDVSIFHLNL